MSNIIEWREPGPQKRGRRSIITSEMLKELHDHPGEWGVLLERPFDNKSKKKVISQISALVRSTNVRLHEKGYQFISRQEDSGKVVMFGRFDNHK